MQYDGLKVLKFNKIKSIQIVLVLLCHGNITRHVMSVRINKMY